jgi:hypothetical protein
VTRRRVPKLEQELTWREASALLGRANDPDGRKLKLLVLAREKQSGRQIAIRLGGEKAPKLRVTLSAIRRAFPDLRAAHADGLATSIRFLAAELDQRHDARTKELIQAELDSDLRPRVGKLEKRTGIMERCIKDLHALDSRESTRIDRTRAPR